MGKGTIVVWNGVYEVRSNHPWRFLWECWYHAVANLWLKHAVNAGPPKFIYHIERRYIVDPVTGKETEIKPAMTFDDIDVYFTED